MRRLRARHEGQTVVCNRHLQKNMAVDMRQQTLIILFTAAASQLVLPFYTWEVEVLAPTLNEQYKTNDTLPGLSFRAPENF